MKREGRQHGMVRTFDGVSSSRKSPRRPDDQCVARPTAGIFTRVSSKPTNHFKGGGGNKQKLKMISRRDVDERLPGLSFVGTSSSETLHRLINSEHYIEDDYEVGNDQEDGLMNGIQDDHEHHLDADDHDEDGDACMSFCDVGFVWEQIHGEDESWCLVGEL